MFSPECENVHGMAMFIVERVHISGKWNVVKWEMKTKITLTVQHHM